MSWTTPRAWIPGELVDAALLNAHLRDNLDFLYAGGGIRESYSQNIVNLTPTPVTITDVVLYDRLAFIDVMAPSNDHATFIAVARGGLGPGWEVSWLGQGGFVVSETIVWAMAGAAAEDYTMIVSSGAGTVTIQKTAAGTITGTTVVKTSILNF